jgi:hypothetical protein
MIDILTLNKMIADWQHFVKQEKNSSSLSPISKQISQLKKELDRSFVEFGDLQETVVTYNLYRQLETLQQQINNIEG